MKPVSMCWAMSVMIAVCVTPGVSSLVRRGVVSHPTMLAQEDGAVAVPGSAEGPGSTSSDEDQSGQAGGNNNGFGDNGFGNNGLGNNGQTPDDDDSAQQPPTSAQQEQQQTP